MKTTRIIVIASAFAIVLYALFPAIMNTLAGGEMDNAIVNSDFETGDLTGWMKTGNAFDYQPTRGNNTGIRRGENSNHQGKWWMGGFEKYQGKDRQEPGDSWAMSLLERSPQRHSAFAGIIYHSSWAAAIIPGSSQMAPVPHA